MNYILHTPSAARLKKEILDKVSEKVEAPVYRYTSTEDVRIGHLPIYEIVET